MARKRFSQIDPAVGLDEMDSFIGNKSDGSPFGIDYKFSRDVLIAGILDYTRKSITASSTSSTLVDGWFEGKIVQLLIVDNQAYQRGVGFSQSGDTITGITITFYAGQKILAYL